MKRALVLLLSLAVVTSGCGAAKGSGSPSGSADTPAGLLAAAKAATKSATSAAFDARVGVRLQGHLAGAGAAGAMLRGPLTLELKGRAGKAANGKAKFDLSFALRYSGGSFTGKALSPDGKVAYVQMPLLMGPGWHSIPLKGMSSSSQGSSADSLAKLRAEGLNPGKWFKNMTVSHADGADTISADLDLPAVFSAIAKLGSKSMGGGPTAAQLKQLEQAVKTAHGSLSFDSSSHLPVRERMQVAIVVPKALAAQSQGLKGVAIAGDIKMSHWNEDFSVSKPAGAKPFDPSSLLGGMSLSAV